MAGVRPVTHSGHAVAPEPIGVGPGNPHRPVVLPPAAAATAPAPVQAQAQARTETAPLRDPFRPAAPRARPITGSHPLPPPDQTRPPEPQPAPHRPPPPVVRPREPSSGYNLMPLTPAPSGLREPSSGWTSVAEPSASFDLGGREPSQTGQQGGVRRSGWSGATQISSSTSLVASSTGSSSSAGINPTVRPQDADAIQAFAALFAREPASEIELAQLAAICTRVSCAPGGVLASKGQPAEVAYIITSGFARMELAADDHPLGAAALRAGDWAGDAVLSGDEVHAHNIVAASDLVMFACERNDLLNLAQRMPQMAARMTTAVMEQSMRRVRLQTNKMTSIAQAALGLSAQPAAEPTSSEGTSISRLFSKLTGKGA